jgi:hypothetical protein
MTAESHDGDSPLEIAILETLVALKPEWQSFASNSVLEANRRAMQRLVQCGFANTRLTYTVTNTQSGRWIRLRYVLSGQFLGNPLMKFMAAQCPRGWFSLTPLEPMPDVVVGTAENDWTLAITADGDRLRKLRDNRALLVQVAQCHNANPVIVKDGMEQGRENGIDQSDGFTDEDRVRLQRVDTGVDELKAKPPSTNSRFGLKLDMAKREVTRTGFEEFCVKLTNKSDQWDLLQWLLQENSITKAVVSNRLSISDESAKKLRQRFNLSFACLNVALTNDPWSLVEAEPA